MPSMKVKNICTNDIQIPRINNKIRTIFQIFVEVNWPQFSKGRKLNNKNEKNPKKDR